MKQLSIYSIYLVFVCQSINQPVCLSVCVSIYIYLSLYTYVREAAILEGISARLVRAVEIARGP
jgi:hypothetical protein